MPRWIGLLGSWALLVLGVAVLGLAATAEIINLKDARVLRRMELINRLVNERHAEEIAAMKKDIDQRARGVSQLQGQLQQTKSEIDDLHDTDQTIVVSTEENRLYLKQGEQTIFETAVSTGKGTTLVDNGRKMIFDTPIGKFHVISKETNPVWVPPDWHYAEEARKRGMRVVRLNRGESIDADTGGAVRKSSGFWSYFDSESGSHRILKVKGGEVVVDEGGYERPLPPGQIITAGNTIVIPPIGTSQRKFDKVLGSFRLNLGDGYAIHGTQATDQLGRSVSHGCVRVGDADLAKLFEMTKVGDEVIIY